MQLFLTVTGGKLSGADRNRTVSYGSLSIGRGSDNGWVLPDPARIVSNTHCIISAEDGRFVLTDVSSNGLYINDAQQATARDSRIILVDGDQVRLGDYVITVAEVDDGPAASSSRGNGTFGSASADLVPGRHKETRDPLDVDPLDDSRSSPGSDTFRRAPDPSFRHPIAQIPATGRIPDPFDDPKSQQPTRPIEPDDDLYRGITPAADWHGAPRPDHSAAPKRAIPPPRVVPSVPPGEIDFDALLGDLKPGSSPPSPQGASPACDVPPTVADDGPTTDVSARRANLSEPPRASSTRSAHYPDAPPRVSETASQEARSADARAAFSVFLAGAGALDQRIDDSDPEAALHAAGQIFRAMADGLREILISRAAIKGEMHVTQTMIRAQGNNALKFSATADDAVVSLLTPQRPGYMDPLAATQEAFTDIKSHELAVIAGMQTALLALLRRFDPSALEERLTKGRLDAVLPAARKARYWDAFRLTYGEISREAEDDFQAAFGRSFAKAYKALTARARTRGV
jgi:type VI secretion system protein